MRSLLLLGSQAAKSSDEYSDYDIVLHVVVPEKYAKADALHVEIGEEWHFFKGDKGPEQGYWRAVIFPLGIRFCETKPITSGSRRFL